MTLYLELGPGAVWGTVLGEPDEITALESTLNEWAVQLGGRPVWLRNQIYGEEGLVVMGGVLPVLAAAGHCQPGVAPLAEEQDRLREDLAAFGDWLWAHQAEAVLAALLAPLGRGIVEVPTGGGKTRIAAAIGAVGGGSWLYVTPNRELLGQAEATFAEASELQGDSVEWYWTTYSQLYDLGAPCGEFRGVIFDECHRIAADTWSIGAAVIKRADYRLGLSGTPLDRTDDKNTLVVGLTGPVVYTVDLKRLQELGRLAQGEVELIEVDE